MQPFTPWIWRDPAVLTADYDDRVTDPPAEADRTDSITADQRAAADLTGYDVEATDGGIGSIDEASYDVGKACLVVDTGPWIFGRKVLMPAGMVQHVDHNERKVYVDRTKEQIKHSPEYDKDTFTTPEYRGRVGDYYSGSYRDAPPMM